MITGCSPSSLLACFNKYTLKPTKCQFLIQERHSVIQSGVKPISGCEHEGPLSDILEVLSQFILKSVEGSFYRALSCDKMF